MSNDSRMSDVYNQLPEHFDGSNMYSTIQMGKLEDKVTSMDGRKESLDDSGVPSSMPTSMKKRIQQAERSETTSYQDSNTFTQNSISRQHQSSRERSRGRIDHLGANPDIYNLNNIRGSRGSSNHEQQRVSSVHSHRSHRSKRGDAIQDNGVFEGSSFGGMQESSFQYQREIAKNGGNKGQRGLATIPKAKLTLNAMQKDESFQMNRSMSGNSNSVRSSNARYRETEQYTSDASQVTLKAPSNVLQGVKAKPSHMGMMSAAKSPGGTGFFNRNTMFGSNRKSISSNSKTSAAFNSKKRKE